MSTDPMPSRLASNGAVEAYAIELGLPPVTFDEAGRIDLVVDGIPLAFCIVDGSEPLLWIGCEIGAVEDHDRAANTWLLKSALRSWARYGGKLGVDQTSGRAVLHVILVESRVSETLLREVVPTMMDDARMLKAALEARRFDDPPDTDTDPRPTDPTTTAPQHGAIFG
ncbi:MAG: CesT family type III secretion system chaperone [Pseudomonadota bacterium]